MGDSMAKESGAFVCSRFRLPLMICQFIGRMACQGLDALRVSLGLIGSFILVILLNFALITRVDKGLSFFGVSFRFVMSIFEQ